MNDSQIETLVISCIETVKKENQQILDEKLSLIDSKDVNEILVEIIGLLLDTMYSTISCTLKNVLCEYNKHDQ